MKVHPSYVRYVKYLIPTAVGGGGATYWYTHRKPSVAAPAAPSPRNCPGNKPQPQPEPQPSEGCPYLMPPSNDQSKK